MTRFSGAVIGCGRMGAFTSDAMRRYAPPVWLPLSHSEAMAAQPDIALAALCDVDADALARAQAQFGIARGYRDYRRLIDEVAPDILGIATRTPERTAIGNYALDKGVRALHLEKPLCNRVTELQRMERLLAPANVVCTYGTLRRYFPIYRRARELARSGRFGKLQQIQVCFGASPLLWCHPHSLDMLLFMAGDVEVSAVSARFAEGGWTAEGSLIDGDPVVVAALVEFASGVTGLIGQAGGWDVVLSCTEGTITVESDGRHVSCRQANGEDPYWQSSDRGEVGGMHTDTGEGRGGTRIALDRLVSGLRGEDPGRVAADKKAILAGQRLLFTCAQSHLSGGARINPNELDPALVITGRRGSDFA